jgi:hypothetical protein
VIESSRIRIVPRAGVLLLALLGLFATAATLPGCQLFSEELNAAPGPAYPDAMPRGSTAPVQVFREVSTLRLTNTTARTFGPGRLWLNQQYSTEVGPFEPGQTLELDLRSFVDEFGDVYRAGGFFAQREPAAVVLAEMESGPSDNRELIGFVVVENKYD